MAERDYTQLPDLIEGCQRLISGLKEDGDEPRMYELILGILQNQPDLILPIFIGSIQLSQEKFGQNRRSGSSATLFYPVDTAIRYTAKRKGLLGGRDPLSSGNWADEDLVRVLALAKTEIAETAGSLTTCKNLPQRTAQMMWLIDKTKEISAEDKLAFIELGASKGLILDALRNPQPFLDWMKQTDSNPLVVYGEKIKDKTFPAIGVDLAIPDDDWTEAMILNDKSRTEVSQFMKRFPDRSIVIKGDALKFPTLPEVKKFMSDNSPAAPFVISCFMLYQLSAADRETVIETSKSFLKQRGGGYLLTTDIAKYVGYPDKAGGAVSWIENQDGKVVSPRIFCQGDNLCKWEIIEEEK